jgi:hypothetical protein
MKDETVNFLTTQPLIPNTQHPTPVIHKWYANVYGSHTEPSTA